MKSTTFYTRVGELLSSGKEFTIADLLETHGSVPQAERAKLIVHPDGRAEGTLGGGDLEARVTADALRVNPGEVRVVEYDLADLGMVCGGAVKVLYYRLQPVPEEQEFYRAVEEHAATGVPFVIAHAVMADEMRLPRLLIVENSVVARAGGTFPAEDGAISAAIELGSPEGRAKLSSPGGAIYLERVAPLPRLLIFGAGHIGASLARTAHDLGLFQVEVADERDELLQKVTQHGVRAHRVGPGFVGRLPALDSRTYVVIVTRSHVTDFTVLKQVLQQDALPRYIGVIGSRNKKREVFERLRTAGVPEERIGRVTMPIGLRIGGKSPSEIAVSILAQLVKVKNGLGAGDEDE